MKSRLSTISPELLGEISKKSSITQLKISRALANWALEQVSYIGTVPDTVKIAEEILANLDAEYLKLQSLSEVGKATEQEVVLAFSKARAIHSLLFSLNEEPLETVYEAIIATENISGALMIVKNIKA
mgnify:CR=1 FL=1